MSIALCKMIEDLPNESKLRDWIAAQASQYKLKYLLAHADDGVIWGRIDNEKLKTADQVNHDKFKCLPVLRLSTLQQCRIFSEAGEILLWKSARRLNARIISDSDVRNPEPNSIEDCIEESQMLWGTHGIQQEGFTLLRDGTQGLKHAIPITENIQFGDQGNLTSKVCLVVSHYIEYDEDGLARINLSRLVDLKTLGETN
jgi:CRISPR-associated protein (TIGR03984 family)